MSTAVVLPAEHRRFRHVVQLVCRNIPLFHGNSATAPQRRGAATHSVQTTAVVFSLRLVDQDGLPGDMVYESEETSGSVHPSWQALPPELTSRLFPNVRRMIFTLYKVEYDHPNHHHHHHHSTPQEVGGATNVSSTTTPPQTTPHRHGDETSPSQLSAAGTTTKATSGERQPQVRRQSPPQLSKTKNSSQLTSDSSVGDDDGKPSADAHYQKVDQEDKHHDDVGEADDGGESESGCMMTLQSEATLLMVRRRSTGGSSMGGGGGDSITTASTATTNNVGGGVDQQQQPHSPNTLMSESLSSSSPLQNNNNRSELDEREEGEETQPADEEDCRGEEDDGGATTTPRHEEEVPSRASASSPVDGTRPPSPNERDHDDEHDIDGGGQQARATATTGATTTAAASTGGHDGPAQLHHDSNTRKHHHHHSVGQKVLLFEFLIDLTKTEFVAKNIGALHDHSNIPAHLEDGPRSFSVLLRCSDGVFFPTMEAAAALSSELDLNKPTPSSQAAFRFARFQQPTANGRSIMPGATFLQHVNQLDDWDVVDGDAAREAEARQQKTDSITLGDIKALGGASIALRRMTQALKECVDTRRDLIDATLQRETHHKVLQAAQHWTTQATMATCMQLTTLKSRQIEELRTNLARRREDLSARRKALLSNSETNRQVTTTGEAKDLNNVVDITPSSQPESVAPDTHTSPSSPANASVVLGSSPLSPSTTRRTPAADALYKQRRQVVRDLTTVFVLCTTNNTICGLKLPTASSSQQGGGIGVGDGGVPIPETSEHAAAIAHVCHAITVFAQVFNVSLPHPILLAPLHCKIFERDGTPMDRALPLFPCAKNSERLQLRRGMDLLRLDIVHAAYHIHNQRQAEGLPLIMAVEKLLVGR